MPELIPPLPPAKESKEHLRHNKLVFYTGIPGVGKDYLLSQLKGEDSNLGEKYNIFPFGELLFQEIQRQKALPSIDTRDSMRDALHAEQVEQLIEKVTNDIIAQQPGVINTHALYRQRQSLIINPHIVQSINPQSFVFVHAHPKDIHRWRSDPTRQRDVLSEEELELLQKMAFDIVRRLGDYIHAPVHLVENSEANLESNMRKLKAIFEQLTV